MQTLRASASVIDPVQLNSFSFSQQFSQDGHIVESRQTVYWIEESKIDASVEFIVKDLEAEGIHGDSIPLFSVADVHLKKRLENISQNIRPRNYIDLNSLGQLKIQRNPSSTEEDNLASFENFY